MKLTDFLSDVGRPVAYYPELRKITGSVTATILLCQFIYWRGKESGQDGWLYKTAGDIQAETGLSYGEQKTARRDLVAAGLIQEHYARLDHQMRFLVNLNAVNDKWGNVVPDNGESGKPTFGNVPKPLSLNESEITTEITTSKSDIFGFMEYSEELKNKQEIDLVEQIAVKLETGLRFNFPRSLKDQQVYKRILKSGISIERFIEWVKSDEKRLSYAFLYAKDTETIWRDLPQINESKVNRQNLEVGF